MAYCFKCGHELMDGAVYCSYCGQAQTNDNSFNQGQRKQVYDGSLHKCPNCGGLIDAFVSSCPACGYELRSVEKTSYVNELSLKLEKINSIDEERELISTFYIPNTKEDIIEFIILASSNIKPKDPLLDAWLSKLEQAYQKAKLSFGNASEFSYVEEIYTEAKQKAGKYKATNVLSKHSRVISGAIVAVVGILMAIIGGVAAHASKDGDSPIWIMSILGMLLFMWSIVIFLGAMKK